MASPGPPPEPSHAPQSSTPHDSAEQSATDSPNDDAAVQPTVVDAKQHQLPPYPDLQIRPLSTIVPPLRNPARESNVFGTGWFDIKFMDLKGEHQKIMALWEKVETKSLDELERRRACRRTGMHRAVFGDQRSSKPAVERVAAQVLDEGEEKKARMAELLEGSEPCHEEPVGHFAVVGGWGRPGSSEGP